MTPVGGVGRVVIWLAGLLVAVGAAVATAHGLYEVALAARVPAVIAWLYPLITDGLALVAYAASARLHGPSGRYAWSVVVLAAGLSGLAQAALLASGTGVDAPALLRFGVGAWPAVAAAIVAHLLYLLATDNPTAAAATAAGPLEVAHAMQAPQPRTDPRPLAEGESGWVGSPDPADPQTSLALFNSPYNVPFNPASPPPPTRPQPAVVERLNGRVEHLPAPVERPVQPWVEHPARTVQTGPTDTSAPTPADPAAGSGVGVAPRDRAVAAAARHAEDHGALPTVSELEGLARVSRGTAATVLKTLRAQPEPAATAGNSTRTEPTS